MIARLLNRAGLLLILSVVFNTVEAAESVSISGKISDEQGRALHEAVISIAGLTTRTGKSGHFSFKTKPADTYQLAISATNYYSFVHTFSRADVIENDVGESFLTVPPISLVRQKKNRRLFVFGGDTMMGRRFVSPRPGEPALVRIETAPNDTRSILKNMRPYLELAHFASINLETQLSDDDLLNPLDKSVTFYSPSTTAQALLWAGVDYVALGNNHMFDYRLAGLEATLSTLDDSGLGYSGAGRGEAAARAPYTISMRGQQLDLLSYVGWPGGFEPNQVATSDKGGAALGTAKTIGEDLASIPSASLAIVQYHSGLEYMSHPSLAEETQLKLAIDRGADLAVGHHSHVYQGVEIYKGSLIAYSLGNFVFDQYLYSTQSSVLLFAWYDGDDFYRGEFVPLHLNGYVPTPASGAIRYDTLQRLVRLSDPESVCWSRTGGHAAFQACTAKLSQSKTQIMRLSRDESALSSQIVSLSSLAADPLRPIETIHTSARYRLGIDILRRGDFEYVGLFDTSDRTWIEDERIGFQSQDSMVMNLSLAAEDTISTGMKVFTRVFSRSNPATVSLKVRTSGCAKFRFYLQRRPDGVAFVDALKDGPITEIGEFIATSREWTAHELDFVLPRTFTRGIRLLFDLENCASDDSPIETQVDELALLEWQTPWYSGGQLIQDSARIQATHLQYRARD